MTLLLFIAFPILFGLYWIIRYQVCANRRRLLADTYGLDPQKLRKMSCKEVTTLNGLIKDMKDDGNAYGIDSVISPYKA